MTIGTDDLGRITQQTAVLAADGDKLGTINQIYTSDTTGDPAWVTLKTGLFGSQESFVPLSDASFDGEDIRVGVTKQQVHDAPRVDADGHLSPDEEDDLYRHYGLHNPGGAEDDVDTDTDADTDIDRRSDTRTEEVADDDETRPSAPVAAAAAAAVPAEQREDELAQRDAEGRDEVADVPDAAPRRAQDDVSDEGTDDDGQDAVKPGERTTRLRRYVVTERVVQTIEELPDDEPGR